MVSPSCPAALPPLEGYISGREAAALMGVSTPTFKRYHLNGRRGVRLRTALIGGKRVTTREWIDAFILGVTATDENPHPELLSSREYEERQEDIAESSERLRAAGILEARQ